MAGLGALPPYFLGLASVHIWVYCSTHRPSLTDDVSTMVVMYLALCASLAAVFLWSRPRGGRGGGRAGRPGGPHAPLAADLACAACMAASGAMLALPTGLPPVAANVAASALGGLGLGWAYARWCALYARLDIRLAAPLALATMALGSACKALVDLLPAAPAAVVLALLPFAAFWCVRRCEGRVTVGTTGAAKDEAADGAVRPADPSPAGAARAPLGTLATPAAPARYYNARTVGSLARLAAGVAVYSLCIGVIQSLLLETTEVGTAAVLLHHGAEVAVALAALAWVGPLGRPLDFCRTWRVIAALIVTALVFEPFLDPGLLGYLLSLVRTAQTYLIVVLFLALANVARHSTYGPYAVFSAGWTAYALPFALGKLAGDAMAAADVALTPALAAIAWVLVLTVLFVLDEGSLGNRLIFADLNDVDDPDSLARRVARAQLALGRRGAGDAGGAGGAGDALADGPDGRGEAPVADMTALRCGRLARERGLTPREAEIFELLAHGRSKTHIAETFFISENTVRNHAKHIYAKLGVHNRQELIDLVEAAEV